MDIKQKIELPEKNLEAIESLLTLSLQGVHHLFDHREIAKILRKPTEELDFFNFENLDKIQELFLELIQHKSFSEKKRFLENLDSESYEIVLRAYFHIVENSAMAANNFKH